MLIALVLPTALAQTPPLDLTRFSGASALSLLPAPNGALYAVGITTAGIAFQTTLGALATQTNRPMVFVQKLAADGSVLISALIVDAGYGAYAAKADPTGNLYLALAPHDVPGFGTWSGSAVIKVSPQLDRIVYATHVFGYNTGPMALDIDTDGSVVTAVVDYFNARVSKLDASGAATGFSYILTDFAQPGGGTTAYDGRFIGVAIAPDHSVTVAVSPIFVYRLDPTGKQLLYSMSAGTARVQLSALCLDGGGNAYVAGLAAYPMPIPATPIDYTTTNPRPHSIVMKLDPAGTSVYTAALATANVTSLAGCSNGSVWGAGYGSGITVFQLNAAGNGFLHYVTLPADQSTVTNLNLDGSGRPLLAGSTTSPQLPDTAPPRYAGNLNPGPSGAFFLRIRSNLEQANVKLSLTPLASAAPVFGNITYKATLSNAGPTLARDVRVVVPPFVSGQTNVNQLLYACQATGNGRCHHAGQLWTIDYPSLAPGQTEIVQFSVTVPFPPSSYMFLSAQTSTDDPAQADNNAYADVVIQTTYLDIQTGPPQIQLQIDNNLQTWYIGSFTNHIFRNPGVPAVPGTNLNVFVPTPQISFDVLYAFAGWSDGSIDNPRTFAVGSDPPVTLNMRPVTEPWVNPDAPVVEAANYRTGPIAPGEIVTLFGYNLGPAAAQQATLDASGRLATQLGGFRVLFDDAPAPVVYSGARQASVIVPYSVAGKTSARMTIEYNGRTSAPVIVRVTDSAPGLLSTNFSGSGQLLAFNADGSANSRVAPAHRGEIVVLYGTGEGLTSPLPGDGEIAGPTPPRPQLPATVTIGGEVSEILYIGGVTGVTAGLLQLNVRVPAKVAGGLLPVLMKVGNNVSQREATIAVR